MTVDLHHPVVDCLLRGLPYGYRNVAAPEGTVVVIGISEVWGGRWLLCRDPGGWRLLKGWGGEVPSRVTIPQELAWLVFTKSVDQDSARSEIAIEGSRDLGERILFTAVVGSARLTASGSSGSRSD